MKSSDKRLGSLRIHHIDDDFVTRIFLFIRGLFRFNARFLRITLQMLAKFAEDDRIEQMNAQKRRMKQLEHKRAVEALIEDRRRRFEEQKVFVFKIFEIV